MLLSNISSEKFSDTVLDGVSTPAGKLQSSRGKTPVLQREDWNPTTGGLFPDRGAICHHSDRMQKPEAQRPPRRRFDRQGSASLTTLDSIYSQAVPSKVLGDRDLSLDVPEVPQ